MYTIIGYKGGQPVGKPVTFAPKDVEAMATRVTGEDLAEGDIDGWAIFDQAGRVVRTGGVTNVRASKTGLYVAGAAAGGLLLWALLR